MPKTHILCILSSETCLVAANVVLSLKRNLTSNSAVAETTLQDGTYRQLTLFSVHLRLIGKPVVNFLLVIIELFSLGVKVEAQRADIEWKSVF